MPVGFARSLFSQGIDTRLITSQATVSATETIDQTSGSMKIGDGAVRSQGGSGQVTITINSPDGGFSFTGSQEFTIEFWMRHSVAGSDIVLNVLNFTNNTNTPNRIQIISSGTAAGSSYTFFNASTTSQNTTNIVTDTYSHVALVCHGDNTFDGYVGGTRRVTNASFFTGSTKTFLIGNSNNPGGSGGWIIDELRVSNNERYTGSSYTPSNSAFTTDANTIALFHFDQDALYTDSAFTG